jgi:hypothetical protein
MRGAVALALCAGFLFAGAPRLRAQAPSSSWGTFTKPEGRITFSMPCTPNWQTSTTETAASGPYTSQLGMCKAGDEIYLVGWVDYAPNFQPNTEAELKANQDNFVKSFQAVLLTSTRTTHQGLPALDFTAQRQQMYMVTSRVIMEGPRPYLYVVVTPINQDRSANISRFANSFRITPAPGR